MFSRKFLIDTCERVIVTMAQVALLLIGADEFSADVDIALGTLAQMVLWGGVICLLKCIVAGQVGSGNTAALLPSGPDTDRGHTNSNTLMMIFCAVVIFILLVLIF